LIDCAPAKIAITPTWGLIGDHPAHHHTYSIILPVTRSVSAE
jgi:hypothetical protein